MKVLLINPNRYQSPPVPPIGLEHVAGSIEREGHTAEILDLCFSLSPFEEIDNAVTSFKPDIVGMTVRNVDTVLYHTNEFFLDEIRGLIEHIKKAYGLKVIIGGTGVSTNPDGVLEYLGADYALAGPAEGGINELLEAIGRSQAPKRIRHRKYRFDISCPRRSDGIDYNKYLELGGIAGFETHKGCSSSCLYCMEANTEVSFKNIPDVISEIRTLAERGFSRFHLCDSEFNEDTDYCIDFLTALKKEKMDINWALYMKPSGFNRKMIKLMKETGVSLITLTVDSWKKCPLYWDDIEKIIFSAKGAGIKIVVDFLAGFPYEEEDTLLFYLDLFRRLQPDGVGINTYIRLYKSLRITQMIMEDCELRKAVTGCTEDGAFVKPVFYNHLGVERLRELIKGDNLFRIEGLEKGVNYSRE